MLDEDVDLKSDIKDGPDDGKEDTVKETRRYVPCHRKAFSLPRTLEPVNEDGSISPCPHIEIESPR